MSDPRNVVGVCGIGASAGGLDPLAELLERLPSTLGIAYLVVQHLSPDHESMMVKLLSRRTSMPVSQLSNGSVLAPNSVYVLGPGDVATVSGPMVSVGAHPRAGSPVAVNRPIDTLFSSLTSWGPAAAAVVLSGTGNDGTLGVTAVREAGGLTLAQDDSALFQDMPEAAERSGSVDAIGDPPELADLVARYYREGERPLNPQALNSSETAVLVELELLTGVNFEDYKRATVRRRIEHRMRAVGLEKLSDLHERVRANPVEASALTHDILIGVTSFFRNPGTFDRLSRLALPDLLRAATDNDEGIRCWSVGCATGQEAYSLAMSLVEARDQIAPTMPVKIFATDVHDGALTIAREGLYTTEQMEGVNLERRERFFTQEATGWRVRPELRALIAFSNHNILTDAPFTRIDLLLCRNTLIYFAQSAQRSALWAFGYALRTGGMIMLGESESLGPAAVDFDTIAPSIHRMTGNRASASLRRIRRVGDLAIRPRFGVPTVPYTFTSHGNQSRATEEQVGAYESILCNEGIGALVVDDTNRLVQVLGAAAAWLEFPAGRPPTDATRLISDVALRTAVSSVLRRLDEGTSRPSEVVSVEGPSGSDLMQVTATSFNTDQGALTLVHARRTNEVGAESEEDREELQADAETTIARLRRELVSAQNQLDATRVQLEEAIRLRETSQHELTATNEELIVSNEELQTSIEELSSTNEELRTLADENELRLNDVLDLSADLEHVLNATDIGVVLLNSDGTIRRFSGSCNRYFRLADGDVGRPFDQVRVSFDDHELRKAVAQAADGHSGTRLRVDRSVSNPLTILVTVSPYPLANREIGVSITVIDISSAQEREQELEILSTRLTDTLDDLSVVLFERTLDLEEHWMSDNVEDVIGISADVWRQFPDIQDGLTADEAAQLLAIRDNLANLTPASPVAEFDLHRNSPGFLDHTIAFKVKVVERDRRRYLRGLAMDVTEARRREAELQRLNQDLDDFTRMASHDLRAPLRAIRQLTDIIRHDHPELVESPLGADLTEISHRVDAMDQLIQDLLNYAEAGSARATPEPVNLQETVTDITRLLSPPTEFAITIDADIAPFVTERLPLVTCIRNLFDNAIKHHDNPAEGRMSLRAQRTTDTLIFTVSDDGPGIPAAHQDKIFRPFWKLSRQKGSGMGLAALKKIVTDRGGVIHLQSEVGRGSSFTVTWPLVRVDPSARPEVTATAAD